MFRDVAMYFRIIVDSVSQTKYFMLMCLVVILAFGSALYVLDEDQQNHFELGIEPVFTGFDNEYEELSSNKTPSEMVDSWFTQYLLMLGEFEILEHEGVEDYPRPSKNLIWTYFFLATLFTNVVFFNTLVAVIGTSYDEKWADREKYALDQRTQIYADYIGILNV